MIAASGWSDARLYLVCDERPDRFIEGALRGGVDIVQLRIKGGDDERDPRRRAAVTGACATQPGHC